MGDVVKLKGIRYSEAGLRIAKALEFENSPYYNREAGPIYVSAEDHKDKRRLQKMLACMAYANPTGIKILTPAEFTKLEEKEQEGATE